MNLDYKKYIKIGAIAIVIVIVVVLGFVASQKGWLKPLSQIGQPAGGVKPGAAADATKSGAFPTRQEAPKNITVPEPGSTPSKSDVAVPKTSVSAAPGVEDKKLRTFEITAISGKYSPSTIIVRVGDTVHIDFKAEDDTYDIVFPDYGLRQQAKKGETKIVEFGATTDGQFTFYCENACPGGKMTGTLIISF